MNRENNVDRRNILDEEPFSYRVTKDKKILLFWYDKHVRTLKGKESEVFISKIENASIKEVQLIIAKITGNFKRGNEKDNKNRKR